MGRPGSPLLLNLGALIAFHTICGHNVMQRKRREKFGRGRAGDRSSVNPCPGAKIKCLTNRARGKNGFEILFIAVCGDKMFFRSKMNQNIKFQFRTILKGALSRQPFLIPGWSRPRKMLNVINRSEVKYIVC